MDITGINKKAGRCEKDRLTFWQPAPPTLILGTERIDLI
jgi:hypothetical protein